MKNKKSVLTQLKFTPDIAYKLLLNLGINEEAAIQEENCMTAVFGHSRKSSNAGTE